MRYYLRGKAKKKFSNQYKEDAISAGTLYKFPIKTTEE